MKQQKTVFSPNSIDHIKTQVLGRIFPKWFNLFYLCLWSMIVLKGTALAQQRLSTPQVIHYSSNDYKAGMQNWDIAQDARGIMYFGNNEGLLTFNGHFWNTYPLTNHTAVRSLEIASNQRIYVGGLGEIGYFEPNANGILTYHSLLPLLASKDRSFGDVWNVSIVGEDVFFQSLAQIMHFHAGKLTVYPSESAWIFMGKATGVLYAQQTDKGLYQWQGNRWKLVSEDPVLKQHSLTSIQPAGRHTLWFTTLQKGIYQWQGGTLSPQKTSADATFITDRIYCAWALENNQYALGTNASGLYIVDRSGKIIQKYTSAEGLPNPNVRGIWLDKNKNLWLALNDGIACITLNSPIQYIYPNGSKPTTGYSMAKVGNLLYAGTSNGLYVAPLEDSPADLSKAQGVFSEIAEGKGQVWRLDLLGKELYMGHENGLFHIQDRQVKEKGNLPGTWTWASFSAQHYVIGTYDGLRQLTASASVTDIAGLRESLRFLYVDSTQHTIWSSHPSRGVFQIKWKPQDSQMASVQVYSKENGLPSSLYNYVYQARGKMVVTTEKGIYEFNAKENWFVPSAFFQKLLGNLAIQYLKEDPEGNIWFVNHKRLGLIDFQTGSQPQILYFPELTGKLVGGFESIYPIDSDNIFVGSNRGFVHINYRQYQKQIQKPAILLSGVKVTGARDSLIFGGYPMVGEGITLQPGMNSLVFEFTSPSYTQQNTTEYSYQLKGVDSEWSTWSTKTEKAYTHLPWGNYTFQVKARTNLGQESDVFTYAFFIEPAWYESYWSYGAYTLILLGVLYQLFAWQRRKHQTEQKQLTYLHQLELDRTEKELVRLQNQQLEADVEFKNKELAAMTMQLVQRGEVLGKVKDVVTTLAKKQDSKDSALSFRQVLRLIRDVESKDADWGQFTLHFNTVNDDFFHLLKLKYPELTPNDLKLCAYLKMNLSSKEIARLMNVTVKAIEIGRYRLRKKLNLNSEINLYEFLVDLSKEPRMNG